MVPILFKMVPILFKIANTNLLRSLYQESLTLECSLNPCSFFPLVRKPPRSVYQSQKRKVQLKLGLLFPKIFIYSDQDHSNPFQYGSNPFQDSQHQFAQKPLAGVPRVLAQPLAQNILSTN